METLTLSQYLEKTANPKRAGKIVKRSVKLFRHATRDLAHAECDLAHAKEDCLHTIEAYENCLEDTKQYLTEWVKCHGEDEDDVKNEEQEKTEEDIFSVDFDEEDEVEADSRLGDHLEHAAADFKHAMKDASDALDNLEELDEYLEELLDEAQEEGFILKLSEVKAEIVRRATEILAEGKSAETEAAPAQETATA